MSDAFTVAKIAEMAHEVNRLFCSQIGDDSQKPWEDAPDWQKDSAIDGVNAIIANPDRKASESHEGWLEHKRNDGWKYGPVKDADKKEHPCFVSYDELPKDQQVKDHLFTGVVKSLISLM